VIEIMEQREKKRKLEMEKGLRQKNENRVR
jgi:hypothetical protein